MAITKTLPVAIPYEKDGKVTQWHLEMKYEDGDANASPSTYYTSTFRKVIPSSENVGDIVINNFTPKAKGEWSKSDIEAVCPVTQWDAIFASQYDSIITNPPEPDPVPDNEFTIPS